MRQKQLTKNIWQCVFVTTIGKVGFCVNENAVCSLGFLPNNSKLIDPTTPAAKKIVSELKSYLRNPKFQFSVNLTVKGTQLQQKIWQTLREIPVGTTVTYGDLAKKLNTSPRVIGNACRQNPVPLIVPCHRVISSHGLGGYAGKCEGKLLEIKQWLLTHEGAIIINPTNEKQN